MPDLDGELAGLRDRLREDVRQPELGAVLERSRQRTSRRRLQFGAVAAVLVVGASIPVLRTVLRPIPDANPPQATSPVETTQVQPKPQPNADQPFVYDIDFLDERHGYALRATCTTGPDTKCVSQLLLTNDGEHWESRELPKEFPQTTGVSATLYVFGQNKVAVGDVFPGGTPRYYTTDGGWTWTLVSPEITPNLDAIPEGGTLEYVCMSQNECEAKLVVMLPDSGQAATLATPPPLTNPVPAANRRVEGGWWVYGKDSAGKWAMSVSWDDGRTWHTAALPNAPASALGISVTGHNNTFYATFSGQLPDVKNGLVAVYLSGNGGLTWQPMWQEAAGKEPRSVGGVLAADDGTLMVNTELGHPYVSKDNGKTFSASNDTRLIGQIRQTKVGYLILPTSRVNPIQLSTDGVHWRETTIK
jgi:photosystem II stability/assembly factor-like uncharacterized protein